MLPIQDVIPSRRIPVVTLTLLALSLGILASQTALPHGDWPAGPMRLDRWSAASDTWSLFLAQFVHADVIGAAINLGALWLFGDNVEDRLGRLRFLLLFAFGGLAACTLAASFRPSAGVDSLAASGPVAVTIGAYLALLPRARIMVMIPVLRRLELADVPAVLIAGVWLVLTGLRYGNGWGPAAPPTDAFVLPLTGLALGALAARMLARAERMRVEWWAP